MPARIPGHITKGHRSITVGDDMWAAVEQVSKEEGDRGISSVIRQAVQEFLDRRETSKRLMSNTKSPEARE